MGMALYQWANAGAQLHLTNGFGFDWKNEAKLQFFIIFRKIYQQQSGLTFSKFRYKRQPWNDNAIVYAAEFREHATEYAADGNAPVI